MCVTSGFNLNLHNLALDYLSVKISVTLIMYVHTVLWSLAQLARTDVTCRILIAYDIRKFVVISAFCGLFDEARRHCLYTQKIRVPET